MERRETWKEKTQWHNVIALGACFAQMTDRLAKGSHVFVQGELSTREYDRTIKFPNGERVVEHVVPQLVVELKPDAAVTLRRNMSRSFLKPVPKSLNRPVPGFPSACRVQKWSSPPTGAHH